MSICKFCGQEVPDGQKCNCPASLSAASDQSVSLNKESVQNQNPVVNNVPDYNPAPAENNGQIIPGVNLSKNQLISIGAAVVGVILVISIIASIASNAYKKPIDKFFNGMVKSKATQMVDSMFDKKMLEDCDYDYDDMVDDLDDGMDDLEELLEHEYGKHVKIKYKVLKKKEIKKKYLEEYEDEYEDEYDFNAHIQKGYEVKVKATIKGSDDDDEEKMEFVVLKIKGHGWKLYPDAMDSFF